MCRFQVTDHYLSCTLCRLIIIISGNFRSAMHQFTSFLAPSGNHVAQLFLWMQSLVSRFAKLELVVAMGLIMAWPFLILVERNSQGTIPTSHRVVAKSSVQVGFARITIPIQTKAPQLVSKLHEPLTKMK